MRVPRSLALGPRVIEVTANKKRRKELNSFRLLLLLLGTITDGNEVHKCVYGLVVGYRLEFEDGLEPAGFILVVQHHYRSNAQ